MEDDQQRYEEENYTRVRLNKQQKKEKRVVQERLERNERLDDFTELNNLKSIMSKGQHKGGKFDRNDKKQRNGGFNGKDRQQKRIGKGKKDFRRFNK